MDSSVQYIAATEILKNIYQSRLPKDQVQEDKNQVRVDIMADV
jgi:hypothetical protein